MMPNPASLILWTNDAVAADALRVPFADAGLSLQIRPLAEGEPANGVPTLALLDGACDPDAALSLCRKVRLQAGESFVPIVCLASPETPPRRGLDAGADLVLPRTVSASDLLAQVQSLMRLKDRHDQLSARAAEASRVNKRLQTAYQQINHELELARRIQQSFLPQSLPELPQVRFAVEYRPCGQVGGDFYDVFRLDEHHLGFYVADAMGHGVAASLLTIFVKKSVRAKEIAGKSYRLVPPDEVLHKLNLDFIDQALSDTPFITMAYGLLNFRDGILHVSRAGHPYPIYIPKDGPPQPWQMEGSLLGVFATQYRLRMHQLLPGDRLLIHTDGFDHAAFGAQPPGGPSLLAAIDVFRHLPLDQMVRRLAMDLFGDAKPSDDLTLLGMEIPPRDGV